MTTRPRSASSASGARCRRSFLRSGGSLGARVVRGERVHGSGGERVGARAGGGPHDEAPAPERVEDDLRPGVAGEPRVPVGPVVAVGHGAPSSSVPGGGPRCRGARLVVQVAGSETGRGERDNPPRAPRRAHGPARRGAGGRARDAAGGPLRRRRRRRAGARGGAVARAAARPPPRRGPRGDGMCARVEFPPPAELVARARGQPRTTRGARAPRLAAARGDRRLHGRDVVRAARHLPRRGGRRVRHPRGPAVRGGPPPRAALRRLRRAPAGHAAGLGGEGRRDGAAGEVPADLGWQAELWRRLRDLGGRPRPERSPRLRRARRRRRRPPRAVLDLRHHPARPRACAVARPRSPRTGMSTCGCRTPRPRCGTRCAARGVRVREPRAATTRRPPSAANPLLRSLSRDVRELQQLLPPPMPASGRPSPRARHAPATLLGRLQDDLATTSSPSPPTPRRRQPHRARLPRPGPPGRGPPRGRARAVADDPTLEPRDILIMCPDVEAFAPLVAAAFGGDERRRTPATGCGCGWPTGRCARPTRCSASSASARARRQPGHRHPAARPGRRGPVRRRFGFNDDDIEQLRDWAPRRRALGAGPAAPRAVRAGRRRAGHLAGGGSTGCCSVWRWRRTTAGSARSCRSTTSTAATSISPAGSPSSSTARRGARPR